MSIYAFAISQEGRTPLHYAAGLCDDRAMYHMLLKYGAKSSITDQVRPCLQFVLIASRILSVFSLVNDECLHMHMPTHTHKPKL